MIVGHTHRRVLRRQGASRSAPHRRLLASDEALTVELARAQPADAYRGHAGVVAAFRAKNRYRHGGPHFCIERRSA